jgi:hypothetical protein
MKPLFFIMTLVVTHFSYGQCKYLINEKDEFTGKLERQTDLAPIGKQAWGSVGRSDSLYYVLVSADVGCVSPGKTKLYIKFVDGEVLELTHQGAIDCKSVVTFLSGINGDMELLSSKNVAKARLSGTERYVDFNFKDAEYFKKALTCLR